MYARKQGFTSRARWLVLVILSIAVVGFVAAFYFYGSPAVGGYPYYGSWFPFPWFFIFPVIFLGFFAFRWFLWGGWGGRWYDNRYNDRATEILKERFARGEITKEQYEQMSKDLENY